MVSILLRAPATSPTSSSGRYSWSTVFSRNFTQFLQQLRSSCTMRRTSTAQPTRQFQSVSISRNSLRPLALSSRRVRSTNETSRCPVVTPEHKRERDLTTRICDVVDIDPLSRGLSSFATVGDTFESHGENVSSATNSVSSFRPCASIYRAFAYYKPSSNDRSISRLVAMLSSSSAASVMPRMLITICEPHPWFSSTCSPDGVTKARKVL